MSSELLQRMGLFVRDLLSYDENLIRIGRQNLERTDFDAAYITVDALATSRLTASGESYDGGAEILRLDDQWHVDVVIDFYGAGAYTRAQGFCARCRSQAGYDLRSALGLGVHRPSDITDVAALTGQQYGERVQVTVPVDHASEVALTTLRIDTAQIEISDETGVKYSG